MDIHKRTPWYLLSLKEVFKKLNASKEGLSDAEAALRLVKYGRNALSQVKRKSLWKMLATQLSNTMILILLGRRRCPRF